MTSIASCLLEKIRESCYSKDPTLNALLPLCNLQVKGKPAVRPLALFLHQRLHLYPHLISKTLVHQNLSLSIPLQIILMNCRALLTMMENSHHSTPRVINVDKNPAYPPAVEELKVESTLPESCNLRQCKYLNNIIEQDHRFIKRRVNPGLGLGFGSFHTANRALQGYEVMNIIRKGQVEGVAKGDIEAQVKFIDQLFTMAA